MDVSTPGQEHPCTPFFPRGGYDQLVEIPSLKSEGDYDSVRIDVFPRS